MISITWISHACFMVEINGTRIYLDPYQIPESYRNFPADFIFASHNHHDHFEEKSIQIINTPNTKIVGPKSCPDIMQYKNSIPVQPGDSGDLGIIHYQTIPAYNPNKRFHPKQNNWCGFIFTIEHKSILFAGDTDDIPEFQDFSGSIDIAILPVGGKYTMDFQEAIHAVGILQPKYVIPCHNWEKDLQKFKLECENAYPKIEVKLLADHKFTF